MKDYLVIGGLSIGDMEEALNQNSHHYLLIAVTFDSKTAHYTIVMRLRGTGDSE